MLLSNIKDPKIRKNALKLEKGLTWEQAIKKAPWKPSYGDCRAFAYDAKTGLAFWH